MLTTEESLVARKQGWQLCEVYDLGRRKLVAQVLPLAFEPPYPSAHHALHAVITRAKQGESVALQALRAVARSNQ